MLMENNSKLGAAGEFVDYKGERCYVIRDVDRMPAFLMSIVSHSDHWLFIASNGGLTAGRVSPETALFPYVSVDKIYDSTHHTGGKSLFRVRAAQETVLWEPFTEQRDHRSGGRRNLYKSFLGNRIWFEEVHDELDLVFSCCWTFSDEFGLIRQCELTNKGAEAVKVQVLDGLQNLLPAGTPRALQAQSSNLVDAYKWNEVDARTGLGIYSLFSGMTDKPEPLESLRATTVFNLGLEVEQILVSSEQLDAFRRHGEVATEDRRRGVRGAYFVASTLDLPAASSREWWIAADLERDQAQTVALRHRLDDRAAMAESLRESIQQGSLELVRLMASCDAIQLTAEENVSTHHYANSLFNALRGGAFVDQYNVGMNDICAMVEHFNHDTYARNRRFLESLPQRLPINQLLTVVGEHGDPWLERLCREYLPLFFGRRHGDPSRPWNEFAIHVRDAAGNPLLSYQGNWRDIFQNWEATAYSYPLFVQNMVARFVNASTVDGYNPYRITKDGIDWEVEDPEDPWSYIGYWGDHQIIYLQKLLELLQAVAPQELRQLLSRSVFCYANVPYRIKPFTDVLARPKDTIEFDQALADTIDRRVAAIGMDGQLIQDQDGKVYLVNLLEKLLVALLSKLANLVVGGGIWMNTQRPEWNDANNALVGHGMSVVTLCYLRRYIAFLDDLLDGQSGDIALSTEVADWLAATSRCLREHRSDLDKAPLADEIRYRILAELGTRASDYRHAVYAQGGFQGERGTDLQAIRDLLEDALFFTEWSIAANRREDGLYHAYNLLRLREPDALGIATLYLMLEGQVAALSSGTIPAQEAVGILESLYASDLYRADQASFMLYPDRPAPGFLDKNLVSVERLARIAGSAELFGDGGSRILVEDLDGKVRFDAAIVNEGALAERLDRLERERGRVAAGLRGEVFTLYEDVFDHKAYTGRSGGMFGFEGLGCIYWHMVSKLLLAAQEAYFRALELEQDSASARQLGTLYYRIRTGIGFNKTPAEYGAFPCDPYSHTPLHAGAQQPGMTGQVKEELLTRYGELGIRIQAGKLQIRPSLLREQEFIAAPQRYAFLDVRGHWQAIDLPERCLAYTYCQVPFVYLIDDGVGGLSVTLEDGGEESFATLDLPSELTGELLQRSGRIARVLVRLPRGLLFAES